MSYLNHNKIIEYIGKENQEYISKHYEEIYKKEFEKKEKFSLSKRYLKLEERLKDRSVTLSKEDQEKFEEIKKKIKEAEAINDVPALKKMSEILNTLPFIKEGKKDDKGNITFVPDIAKLNDYFDKIVNNKISEEINKITHGRIKDFDELLKKREQVIAIIKTYRHLKTHDPKAAAEVFESIKKKVQEYSIKEIDSYSNKLFEKYRTEGFKRYDNLEKRVVGYLDKGLDIYKTWDKKIRSWDTQLNDATVIINNVNIISSKTKDKILINTQRLGTITTALDRFNKHVVKYRQIVTEKLAQARAWVNKQIDRLKTYVTDKVKGYASKALGSALGRLKW